MHASDRLEIAALAERLAWLEARLAEQAIENPPPFEGLPSAPPGSLRPPPGRGPRSALSSAGAPLSYRAESESAHAELAARLEAAHDRIEALTGEVARLAHALGVAETRARVFAEELARRDAHVPQTPEMAPRTGPALSPIGGYRTASGRAPFGKSSRFSAGNE